MKKVLFTLIVGFIFVILVLAMAHAQNDTVGNLLALNEMLIPDFSMRGYYPYDVGIELGMEGYHPRIAMPLNTDWAAGSVAAFVQQPAYVGSTTDYARLSNYAGGMDWTGGKSYFMETVSRNVYMGLEAVGGPTGILYANARDILNVGGMPQSFGLPGTYMGQANLTAAASGFSLFGPYTANQWTSGVPGVITSGTLYMGDMLRPNKETETVPSGGPPVPYWAREIEYKGALFPERRPIESDVNAMWYGFAP